MLETATGSLKNKFQKGQLVSRTYICVIALTILGWTYTAFGMEKEKAKSEAQEEAREATKEANIKDLESGKTAIIARLSDTRVADIIDFFVSQKKYDLLDLTLKTYLDRLKGRMQVSEDGQTAESAPQKFNSVGDKRQKVTPDRSGYPEVAEEQRLYQPHRLRALVARAVAQRVRKINNARTLKILPLELRELVLQSKQLTESTFSLLDEWLNELRDEVIPKDGKQDFSDKPYVHIPDFSAEQYVHLIWIARHIRLKKPHSKAMAGELRQIRDDKVRFTVLRCLIRASGLKLKTRAKLAVTMALAEKNEWRERILEELAIQIELKFDPIFLTKFFFKFPPDASRVFFTKAFLINICEVIDQLKNSPQGLLKFIENRDYRCSAFSTDVIELLIYAIRGSLAKNEVSADAVKMLAQLLRANDLPNKAEVWHWHAHEMIFDIEDIIEFLIFLKKPISDEIKCSKMHTEGTNAKKLHDFFCKDTASFCLELLNGADINAQNSKGDTPAHVALRKKNFKLILLLARLNYLGFKVDMNCVNKQKETPVQLLQSIQFVKKMEETPIDPLQSVKFANKKKKTPVNPLESVKPVSVLSPLNMSVTAFAGSTNVALSQEQIDSLANGMPDVAASAWLEKGDFISKQSQVRPRLIKMILNSQKSQESLTDLLKRAWVFALKEKNGEIRDQLLEPLEQIACQIKEKGSLPTLLRNQQKLKELFYFVYEVTEGKKNILADLPEGELFPLIELLEYLGCFNSVFERINISEDLTCKLLYEASTMGQESSEVYHFISLILNGADLNECDDAGNSLFHYTILRGNFKLFKELLRIFFLNIRILDKKNAQGETALILAAQRETKECPYTRLLLEKYADRSHCKGNDNRKCNALHYLLANGWATDPYFIEQYKLKILNDCPCQEASCQARLENLKLILPLY